MICTVVVAMMLLLMYAFITILLTCGDSLMDSLFLICISPYNVKAFFYFDKVDARCLVTKYGFVLFLFYNFSKLSNSFEFCFVFFTRKLFEILLYISK